MLSCFTESACTDFTCSGSIALTSHSKLLFIRFQMVENSGILFKFFCESVLHYDHPQPPPFISIPLYIPTPKKRLENLFRVRVFSDESITSRSIYDECFIESCKNTSIDTHIPVFQWGTDAFYLGLEGDLVGRSKEPWSARESMQSNTSLGNRTRKTVSVSCLECERLFTANANNLR